MRLVPAEPDRHGEAVRAIYNELIPHSTALYEDEPRTPAFIAEWFRVRQERGLPILALEDDAGTLLGFATYGPFRPQPGYRHTFEHSVYVHPAHRGRGYGETLLRALIAEARRRGVHVLIGVIDTENTGSVRFHERLGFVHAGTLRQVGTKFGRWLDAAFYQLVLD